MVRTLTGGPDVKPGPPPDRMTVLLTAYSLLEQIHHAIDQGEAEIERANLGRPICVDSCGKCCEVNVPVAMKIEVMYLQSLLGLMPTRVSKSLTSRALGWLQEDTDGLTHDLRQVDRPLSEQERKTLIREQFEMAHEGCPFLSNDKKCLAHSGRPLVCRGYGVTIHQDKWCPRPLGSGETDEMRLNVVPDTGLGQRINALLDALWAYLNQYAPDLAISSWFPTAFAQERSPARYKKLALSGKVPNVKLAIGRKKPQLFVGQEVIAGGIAASRESSTVSSPQSGLVPISPGE